MEEKTSTPKIHIFVLKRPARGEDVVQTQALAPEEGCNTSNFTPQLPIYIYISSWYGFFLPHHYIITSLINFSNKFRMAFLRLSDAPLLARPPLQPTDREMQGDEASDSHDIKKQLPTLQLLTYTCMLSVCRRNIHIYIGMCMIYDICIV